MCKPNCKYFLYNECIRKSVVQDCPYYDFGILELRDIFLVPATGDWAVYSEDIEAVELIHGHILDVCASSYVEPYLVISPTKGTAVQAKPKGSVYDMNVYMPFINADIYSLYIESFLFDYLSHPDYIIDRIDCSGQFVHIQYRRI